MPNPFWSALAPSIGSSLAGGATGALQGMAAGDDRDLNNRLKEAQIGWQQAHAAGYGHMQRTSANAMAQLQIELAKDPNFLRTDAGRFLAYTAGKFDPLTQDALANARNQQGYASGMHGDLFGAQTGTVEAMRAPTVDAMTQLGGERKAIGDQYTALTPGKVAEIDSRTGLNQARVKSEGALANMRNWQGQLAKERAALQAQAVKAGQGGKSMNLYSLASMLNDRINGALDAGQDPDPNDVILYDDVRTKIRGADFGAMPLGSPGVYNRGTGEIPQPAVPEQRGMFGFGAPVPGTGKPATPPTKLPLNLTPRTPKASLAPAPAGVRPGDVQREQDVLKARKLIQERGQKFASDQLKSNKALTPTERLALQEALEKAMTSSSISAP